MGLESSEIEKTTTTTTTNKVVADNNLKVWYSNKDVLTTNKQD